MRRAYRIVTGLLVLAAAGAAAVLIAARLATRAEIVVPEHAASAAYGEYLFAAAGCKGCHTDTADGAVMAAGGRALKTPFGTFYGPNITPHPEHGIGGWSDADFIRALRQGVAPDGSDYYPAFPYASFTGMTDTDMLDLKAYLDTLAPAAVANRPHDLPLPLKFRPALAVWKLLYLRPGPLAAEGGRTRDWLRGRYLVRALGHCGECHTPRDALGGPVADMFLAGTRSGPEGKPIPNITPHDGTGIGGWKPNDIAFLLEIGMVPDGDFVGAAMGEVVEESTTKLTAEDRAAIAEYLLSLPAVENAVR